MSPEYVGFDLAAFKRTIEGSVVRSMLRSTPTDEATRQIVFKALAVFERHGIGAVQAMQIMSELGEAMK